MPGIETKFIIEFLEWLEPVLVLLIRSLGFSFAFASLYYYFTGLTEEAQYWVMLSIAMFLVQQG